MFRGIGGIIVIIVIIIAAFLASAREVRAGNKEACLTRVLYNEARGESDRGIINVLNVIHNRKRSKSFPNTLCGVIYQKSQFYTASIPIREKKKWKHIKGIVRDYLDGDIKMKDKRILFFHSRKRTPSSFKRLSFVKSVGSHKFYKF